MECIIGILSLLVTALIGFQLYTLFDIRKIQKDVKEKRNHVIYESERNLLVLTMALSDFFYSLIVDQVMTDKEFKYLHYKFLSLFHASKIKDYQTCNVLVRSLLETMPSELELSKSNKTILLGILLSIEGSKNVDGFQTLLSKIVSSH